MRSPALLLAVAVAMSAALAAVAAEDPVDYTEFSLAELMQTDVVYGASKFDQKAKDAPSSVTIITAADIRAFGWRTLAEVLGSVRGFYLTYDRDYHYLGARGFGRPGDYNSRVLVLIDGVRVNDNVYDSALLGREFPLDLALIRRIEVIRGPSSSLYGTSAVFAIVNIVTRAAHEFQGVQVTGEVGSWGAREGQVAVGRYRQDGVSAVFSAAAGRIDGQDHHFAEFDAPATNGGVAAGADATRWRRVFGRIDRGPLHLEALYGWQKKHVPTAPWGTIFNDDRTATEDNQGYAAAWFDGEIAPRSRLLARTSLGRYDYAGAWAYDYADPGDPPQPVLLRDNGIGRWLDAELQFTRGLGGGHMVAAGGEFRRNFRQDQAVWDEDPYLLYTDVRRDSWNWAAFLLGEWCVDEALRVNVGVRRDEYSTFGSSTNPRLAVVAEPRAGTVAKLLYGSAFRAPNAYELSYDDGGVYQKANPDLRPETIRTVELVLDQELGGSASGTVSVYRYTNRDLIDQALDPGDGLLVFRNNAEVEAEGFELEFRHQARSAWNATASYGYQDARYADGGGRLTNSPRHMAKGSVRRQLFGATTSAGLTVQYYGGRLNPRGGSTAGFVVANFTLVHAPFNARYEVSAGVYNLLDSEHAHPGGLDLLQREVRQDGRNLRLGVVVRP